MNVRLMLMQFIVVVQIDIYGQKQQMHIVKNKKTYMIFFCKIL